MKYICKKCGTVNKERWRANPQRGTYTTVKCECGAKGISDWYYDIEGFTKQKEVG